MVSVYTPGRVKVAKLFFSIELTDGIRTAIWLAEELTDAKFEIEEEPVGTVVIRCQGIGHTAETKEDSTMTDGSTANSGEI